MMANKPCTCVSEEASFSLQKKIRLSLQASPLLVWSWKVTELPK